MASQQGHDVRARQRIEVAGQDHRAGLIGEDLGEPDRLTQLFLAGPDEMDPHEDDLGAVISQPHGPGEGGAVLDAFGEQVVRRRDERVPREQRHPVAAALVVEEGAEDGMHPGQLAQHGRLIDATRALHHAVHFLQRDQVRFQCVDHAGDPLQVDHPVHPFAVFDVVGEDAERLGAKGFGGWWWSGRRGAHRGAAPPRGGHRHDDDGHQRANPSNERTHGAPCPIG